MSRRKLQAGENVVALKIREIRPHFPYLDCKQLDGRGSSGQE
jgi:hypothetical protein